VRILAGFVERAHAELVPAERKIELLRALARDGHYSYGVRRQRNVKKENAVLFFRACGGVVNRELRDARMLRLAALARWRRAEIVVEFYIDAVPCVRAWSLRRCRRCQ